MAKKTLASIRVEIEKLEAQAAALKSKEAAGVIARIKEAIAFYELTPADLFDTLTSTSTPPARKPSPEPRTTVNKKLANPRPIKFADDQGNSWVGHGKRPAWFVKAIESGKTTADLLVQTSPT